MNRIAVRTAALSSGSVSFMGFRRASRFMIGRFCTLADVAPSNKPCCHWRRVRSRVVEPKMWEGARGRTRGRDAGVGQRPGTS